MTMTRQRMPMVSTARRLLAQSACSPEPSRVNIPDGERVTSMAGGFGFCVAALAGGGAVAFGLNDRFQCGHNDRLTRDVPLRIGSLGRKQLIAVACGQQHACVVDEHGQCYTWGMGALVS